ncbi:MAG TPA: TSUP family transporter, partial [Thermoplasmata archaeon]|nr:TSUP family transporter [Thermoplasmata archaeon]
MDAVLLLIQAVLIFGVAFIYANLGLGGGLLFVPILLSTGVPDKDLAVPISLTLTIATATSSVINHHRRGLVDFRLGGVLLTGALIGAVVGTVFTLKVLNQE